MATLAYGRLWRHLGSRVDKCRCCGCHFVEDELILCGSS
jgi:hypothetical protein